MYSYLQITGDPAKWWLEQPLQASQLTGQPLSVPVKAPLAGTLLLSARSASVAVFNSPFEGAVPSDQKLPAPVIYLPTAAGPSAQFAGYELPATTDLAKLAGEITALMHGGGSLDIPLGGAATGGVLMLNGATVPFVVLCQATAGPTGDSSGGGAVPSD